ncbi:hypothetical protein Goklo_018576 [Gossypium klotzschianum]|uniref:Uncharacterized protein n=1 Tax=Gossypium klotzschianum TaxID=34286 RepID=A0A7J8ULD2_9ROSI|nr:hypothetical protein [Gossypium klotzschianum]
MASNVRANMGILSKALTRLRPTGALYSLPNQSLPPPKHWVPSSSFSAAAAVASSQSLHGILSYQIKRKDQNGQDGFFSFLELSLSALELGRFSEGKTRFYANQVPTLPRLFQVPMSNFLFDTYLDMDRDAGSQTEEVANGTFETK